MPDSYTLVISSAMEGDLDEAVLRRLIEQENVVLKSYGRKGKEKRSKSD